MPTRQPPANPLVMRWTIPNLLTVARVLSAPAVFTALKEARVILTTGEQMYQRPATEAEVVGDHLELKFPGTLYNASTTRRHSPGRSVQASPIRKARKGGARFSMVPAPTRPPT